MELGTFGAILKFAIEFEQVCAKFYREAGLNNGNWQALAASADKRAARLDRVRREMVTEMILEPITGLQAAAYQCDWNVSAPDRIIAQARAIEEMGRRFYGDMASCVSIAEVVRAFKKLAQEHENNRLALG